MRYRDAAHVDTGSFFARRPCVGGWYRLIGHGAAVAAALVHDTTTLAALLIACVVAWLSAWFLVVGTLWRASLVAAAAICAVKLALAKGCA